ncbi:MAG: AraC family transcriptional regulator [Faecousia sp.]
MNPEKAINWKDRFFVSDRRVVMTNDQLRIPGVRTFGWHDMKTAVPALNQHYHENAIEITFVTKGLIVFGIDGKKSAVAGGDAFLTQPNVVHSTEEVPMGIGEICWIQLDISDEDNFLFLRKDAAHDMIQSLSSIPNGCIHTDNKECTRILKEIIRDILEVPVAYSPFRMGSYLSVYLDMLMRFTSASAPRITPDIQRVCTYISKNITEPLTLEQLADVSGLSLPQFKNKFKQQIGTPPRRYVNQEKISAIKPLLTKGCSITDLAIEFGFCDSSYFSAVFKKHTGVTPSNYMKLHDNLRISNDPELTSHSDVSFSL